MTPTPKHVTIAMGDAHSVDTSSHKSTSRKFPLFKKLFPKKSRRSSLPTAETASLTGTDLKSAGTFDTTVEDNYPYEHPRSQNRLAKKWGHIQAKAKIPLWREELMRGTWEEELTGENLLQRSKSSRATGSMIKAAQDRIRQSMEFSLWHCLVAIAVYVAGTVYCFTFWLEPDWTVVDSVYFAVVTFTTIGYGDVVPDTRSARIFTSLWALSGVACLGIALGVLGSQLVEVAEQEQKKQSNQRSSDVFDMFNIDHVPRHVRSAGDESTTASNFSDLGSQDAPEYALHQFLVQGNEEEVEEQQPCCSPKTVRFFWLSVFMVVILFFMSQNEGWNPWATGYYGLITACTVGYGDFAPKTQTGRVLAILYIPVAVSVIGSFLELISNSIITFRRQRAQRQLRNKELTLEDLKVMDGDGDGTVTKAEFLEFMLVAMNQVDQDLLDNLKAHFDRLDQDKSGTLDKNDLINVAQYNLRKEKSIKRFKV